MTMLRTTLPKGSNPKAVLSKWRKIQPAQYELVYETDDQITRVSSPEPGIAWGECISYALARDLVMLPEHWTCLRSDGTEWRAVYVSNGIVRRDELIHLSPERLSEWLKVNVSDAVYSTNALDFDYQGTEITILGTLELEPERWQLAEYKGSAGVLWLKRGLVTGTLIGLVLWVSWPEPPPPPPPESLDPWYGYKTSWEGAQLAGETITKVGTTCAAFSTFPLSRDISGGTIDQGGINVSLPISLAVDRELIVNWTKKQGFGVSFEGPTAFIRIPLTINGEWRNKAISFDKIDARIYDLFNGLSHISESKVNFEQKQGHGIWTSRKASINMVSSPWLLVEVGKNLSSLPIKFESGSFSVNENGSCSLSGALIEFGGVTK